ncbi:Usherin, partial [Oryzias melastigma]
MPLMLLEKSSATRLSFSVAVSEDAVMLQYGQSSSPKTSSVSFRTEGRLQLETWTHLTLQIHDRHASLFIDGLEDDGTPFDTKDLTSMLFDVGDDGAMWVGRSSNGSNQFIGRMQDFRFYPATLTNREIVELYSGVFPKLHVQSECRCPPSHSRVHPLIERYCIPNAVEDTTTDRVLRLNLKAHSLGYINDQDMSTAWLSKIMTTQELEEGVTITVDLSNGQYQVFYVILQFGGLLPESVRIQRRKLNLRASESDIGTEQPWLDWQYMARNCSDFEMQNNGPLLRPDSVNCVQLPRDVSLSGGNITFSLLTSLRPGYNDFYKSPALQEMVQASQVRIHLRGLYHSRAAGVNSRHKYFAIREITISGRCECHGHADHCDTSVTPYRCLCLPESHTVGNNCERCAPLYNDKPFRPGDQLQPMNCRPCECHGHALSCHYDAEADDQPDEHYRAGGGVCDSCMHNTTGKNCEECMSGFFRLQDSDPSSADVCQPCNCNTAGTINSSSECAQIGGQCRCKVTVTGRQCTECLPGWYGLDSSDPKGCISCNCSDLGTVSTTSGEVPSCDQNTGQCQCKPHVTGLTCDHCEFGFWNLSHPEGCIPCDCDPLGSLSLFCEPERGQCECKSGVGGRRCDSCGRGLYGLRTEGTCSTCNCSRSGTEPGTDCDPYTGQCEHVTGHHCDSCRHGYHTLEQRNSLGCLPCVCDSSGTVAEGVCDTMTGQCPCKEGVEGVQCNKCASNYYNKSSDMEEVLFQGCAPCICDPRGTVAGSVCDSTTGQCVCVPTRHGKDCRNCRPGFHLSPDHSLCLECDCHPTGASSGDCDIQTGQCVCADSSVGGQRCDQCVEMFFGFNPGLGSRCQPCACDQAGSVNGSCHPDTGACVCKLLVTGGKCDSCQPGASHLDPENLFGCSKAPSQQPAPLGFALSYSTIHLSWNPPDSPNSHKLNYTLLRDGQSVQTIQSFHPFTPESFEDTGLFPYTNYTYWLITSNVAGETISGSASYQTLSSPPEADDLHVNLLGRPAPTSATFSWSTPRNDTGPVEKFVLSTSESLHGADPVVHYTGLSTQAVATGLKPFTQYTAVLDACSSGGCTSSAPLSFLTAAALPQNQPAPRVTAAGPHTLHVSWEPPREPNGVITRYEVFLRGPLDPQNLSTLAVPRRVFYSSGWLDPSVSLEKARVNRSEASPPESTTIIAGLQAFSTYQLRVVSINSAGSVTSDWTTARTEEGVPEFVAPPEVSALSATSLQVTWNNTEGEGLIARGEVKEYQVNLLTLQTTNPYAPPVVSKVLHRVEQSSPPMYVVKGLKPFHVYNFTVTLCTRTGCISSQPSTGRTLPAAPTNLLSPQLHPVNESTIHITWDPPGQLNGPSPLYQVERTDVSLSDPQQRVVRGTRFPGNGYYLFPSNILPSNSDFTGIQISFKTRSPDGLLLCAFSPGDQEEFLAVQLKSGRPYFLFDPQGSAVAVSVNNDGGHSYSDGQWHTITALRRGAVGTIVLDDRYSGSASASSGSTIIGENMGVFIGGLPKDFVLLREDTGDAQLVRQGFSGCLRDVSLKMTDNPSEEWQSLDWTKATERVAVYESWEGCPSETVDGAYFLGHGYLELSPHVFSGGQDFKISMELRTDQLNALLLFTYHTQSEDYMLVELNSGLLSFTLASNGHATELSMWVGLSYCDGDWKQVSLAKRGSVISAAVDDWEEEIKGVAGAKLRVDSPFYLGGVPTKLVHSALKDHSYKQGLGGCIRGLRIHSDERNPPVSQRVHLSVASRRSARVNLDGCPTSESRFHCRGNDSVLVYSGRNTDAMDYSLQPFTEHLYRFVALGAGGWTSGPWQRGRSRGKAPVSVPPPSAVQSINGFSAAVNWLPPTDNRGPIDRYELRAYNRDSPEVPPVKASYPADGNFTGVLTGLTPSTRYIITVSACGPDGCTESTIDSDSGNDLGFSLTTPVEAPEGVCSPSAVSSPSALFVTWEPPGRPNGEITHYLLYHNDQMVYRGKNRHHNITGGCVQSQINGVLEFYSIYLSPDGAEPLLAYNSTAVVEDHTLRKLNSWDILRHYSRCNVTLNVCICAWKACTGGGCTSSPPSQAQTEESTPENVPAPLVTPLSPHALNVSWSPPHTPNGVITSYGLWLDGVLKVNSSSSERFFVVEGLSPWSRHILRLQACTAQGCGKGPMVEMRTLESAPEGPLLLELTNQSARSLQARWTAPPRANGHLNYTLYYKSKGIYVTVSIYLCVSDSESLSDGGSTAGVWMSVTDLQPYTNYSFYVRGCNTQGCVESLPLTVTTLPAAPDGLSPPSVVNSTSTSLNVSWTSPANSNAPGPLYYSLQMRTSPHRLIVRLVDNATDTFYYYVTGLSPHTQYQFRVVVSHLHGKTAGAWETFSTAEDSPGPLEPPSVLGLQSKSVLASWTSPTQPNGVITNYTLYLLTPLSVTVPGNTTSFAFVDLLPYQTYILQVEACNSVGCSVSSMSQRFQTLPAPPEGVPAPHLYSDTPTSVLLSWGAPEKSNGPLERWLMERRLVGTKKVSIVGHLPPDPPPLSFLDSSSALSPWTTYQYRLVLQNQAGNATGKRPWVNVTTRPSRPAGVSPPKVKVLGPESLQIAWSPPLIPNGEVHGYEIRLPEPRFSHHAGDGSLLNVTVANLVPYTNYSVTVLACSEGGGHVGGCTESLPTPATTFPTSPGGLAPLSIVSVSESFLAISWQPPNRPNGPNIRYKLLRRKTREPLAATSAPASTAPSPPPSEDLHRWLHVYSGTKLFYQDKGLSRFTQYQYQLEVQNDMGHTAGEVFTAWTMAGVPQKSPSVSVHAVNHTALQVNWTQPSLQDLQGEVECFFLTVEPPQPGLTRTFGPEDKSIVISNLWPSTNYQVSLQVFNGAHNTSKTIVNATTADGKPEGMLAPEVVPVNSSTARVLWFPPLQPNGAVTGYNIYVNDHLNESVDPNSGSYLLGDLLPFTIYSIQVEVCTKYACTRSNATKTTTVEDLPAEWTTPHAQVIGPRSVRLHWSHPGKPNGIMLGYEVLRRTLRSCAQGATRVTPSSGRHLNNAGVSRFRCSYLQCPLNHDVCVTSCFDPDTQVCCSGQLHMKKPHHYCCDGSYMSWNNFSIPVCCDGKLIPSLPGHQCCEGYYVLVKTNEYCCPDHLQGRVSVGLGDRCCGGVPYSMTGGQLCCSGSLHDGYGVQCCGGRLVDDALVCCGNAESGEVYKDTPGFICCGTEYINSSTSLCCLGNDGYPIIHPAGNATVTLKCCGSTVIHQDEECCSGVGFDPQHHVCADRATPGLVIQHQCLRGSVCPVAAAASAYCGSCDLDPSLTACTWVLIDTQSMPHSPFISEIQGTRTAGLSVHANRNNTYKIADIYSHSNTEHVPSEGSLCPSPEEVVYSGDASSQSYTDSDLEPFTIYEYRVGGWNSFGRSSSNITAVTTSEDKPWGVAPPRWSRLGERDDIIQLKWQSPARPNGRITHFVILRDGQERYRGDESSFTDVGGIRPLQEYGYQLRACNRAGCTDSTKVMAVTVQGVPEGVLPPVVKALSPSSLSVSWSEPSRQNGIIQFYHLNQTGFGTVFTHTGGPRNYTVNGLQPYTNYSFVLEACTAVGCGVSLPSTGLTLQAKPAGVWSKPRHLIINTSAVELYWDQPSQPNGLISQYRLIRDGLTVFTGARRDQNCTDTGLEPKRRYVYELEAVTGGGTGVSDQYAVQTPASCPTGIPPPHRVTALGPFSVSLAWSPPAHFNNSEPVYYNILFNGGSHNARMFHGGQHLQLSVSALEPFTIYHVRVQACQSGGCGVGEGVYIRTLETAPERLSPPTVKAAGAKVLEISWTPPLKPN